MSALLTASNRLHMSAKPADERVSSNERSTRTCQAQAQSARVSRGRRGDCIRGGAVQRAHARRRAIARGGLPIIRDAEIEQLLRDYTQPILRVAGLAKQNVRVVIINDRSFNAFVMDGHRIFVNAGALLEFDDAEPAYRRARA